MLLSYQIEANIYESLREAQRVVFTVPKMAEGDVQISFGEKDDVCIQNFISKAGQKF